MFKTTPYKHQVEIINFAKDKNKVMIWSGIGTGKSKIALDLINLWKCDKTLIICPTSVINTWREQIQIHSYHDYTVLEGSKEERIRKLDNRSKIDILNYEGLKVVFGEKIKNKRGEGRFKVGIINKSYDCIIADEIHRFKNYRSLQSRIARILCARARKVIFLTATPIANSELDLWSEFFVMDGGETLGRSFWRFANYFGIPKVFGGFEFNKKKRDELLQLIKPKTIRVDREKCLDLPKKIYVTRKVDFSEKQREIYEKTEKGLLVLLDDTEIDVTQILTKINKLSQITSGFVYTGNDIFEFKENPKLKALEEILQELGRNEKIIIYHRFKYDYNLISKLCKKMDLKFTSCKEDNFLYKFKNKVNILISQIQSGSEGLNLQFSSNIIYYSNTYSYLNREQSEGRIYRAGQKNNCLFIDLIIKDSIDEKILKIIKNKEEISKLILDLIEKRRFL